MLIVPIALGLALYAIALHGVIVHAFRPVIAALGG